MYSVSDISGAAAKPLTISITIVEVAFVTGSLLFIAQADSTSHAQQHTAQLQAAGTDANIAMTADLASVLHQWLTSASSSYVDQMTEGLGANTEVIAAIDVLELGLFSTVQQADVTVLSASIDWDISAALNTNSSDATQNYVYNVTVQVAVLTCNMLLSVYVDVLSNPPSRRRLHSTSYSDNQLSGGVHYSTESTPCMQTTSAHAAASSSCSSNVLGLSSQSVLQQMSSMPAERLGLGTAQEDLHAHLRSLMSTSSSSSFPLASLLAFKTSLVLAAFAATSGCSTDSLTPLFFQDSEAPQDLSDVCVGDDSSADYSMNAALSASASPSVPLLQVCLYSAILCVSSVDACLCHAVKPDMHMIVQGSWPILHWLAVSKRPSQHFSCLVHTR